MSFAPSRSHSPMSLASLSPRAGLFLAIFGFVLLTLHPFADLNGESPSSAADGKDAPVYILFAAFAAVCVSWFRSTDRPALQALRQPAYFALGGWVAVTSLLSVDPSTSIKRAILMALVAICAAAAPLLPGGRRELIGLLAAAAAFIIALSYFGVMFLPHLAIHQFGDTVEPELGGDWRGVFSHKNVASPVFSILAFGGLFIARAGRPLVGVAVAAASLIFLLFTHGKTSTGLWVPALLVSLLAFPMRANALWCAMALTPLLLLNAVGFGSKVFPLFAQWAQALPLDATFTGRGDIWAYAAQRIGDRPIAGYGVGAFWDNSGLKFNFEGGWLASAAHAHNGYAETALAMGVVGVALVVWALVIQPMRDLRAAVRRGADPAMTSFCVQVWMFGLWLSTLETFLFDRANPVWFLFLFSVFGLRYLASFRIAP